MKNKTISKRITSTLIAVAIIITAVASFTATASARQDILDLSGMGITDEMLAQMIKDGTIPADVTRLNLSNNLITDVTPLANLKFLEWLDLSYNQIKDISPLANLKLLGYLDLRYNLISDLTPLYGLKNLWNVQLDGNNLSQSQIDEFYTTVGIDNNPKAGVVLAVLPVLVAGGVVLSSRKR